MAVDMKIVFNMMKKHLHITVINLYTRMNKRETNIIKTKPNYTVKQILFTITTNFNNDNRKQEKKSHRVVEKTIKIKRKKEQNKVFLCSLKSATGR